MACLFLDMRHTISVEELSQLMTSNPAVRLIDVRSAGEYAAGHVPQATNIPLEQVEMRLDDLGGGPVALLCHSGNRASMACELLADHHPELLVVEGGTQAWIGAGKPIVGSSSSRWSLERQVRLLAGLMILVGTILAVTVNPAWLYLAMFVGAGLTFAGATNVCGMASLLALLPWNQPAKGKTCTKEVQA